MDSDDVRITPVVDDSQVNHSPSVGSGATPEEPPATAAAATSSRTRAYTWSVRERRLTEPPPRPRLGLLHFIAKKAGGNFENEPEDMVDYSDPNNVQCKLSPECRAVLREVFADVAPTEVVDYHVHLVGHGDSGSGCHIHPTTKDWKNPVKRLKSAIFMAAAQVPDMDNGDIQYISRLLRLVEHYLPAQILNETSTGYVHGKICVLAFDGYYEKDGRKNMERTTLYVPNEYAYQCAKDFPDMCVPVGSVNPYRQDAIQELENCASNGVTIIKWLPNSMGINPKDEECVPFYEKLKELDMALLVHVGNEHTVNAGFIDDSLGNPLLLRGPLDHGVKVIAAHCASEGKCMDLDNNNQTVECFDMFLRLMRESKYKDLLFGDISAITAFKRVGYLTRVLEATDIHDRLVYGSDYPVPAINLVVSTKKMARRGIITQAQKDALNELYHFNPLLFDVACKRLARGPNGEFFPPGVFKAHPKLPIQRPVVPAATPSMTEAINS